MFPEYEQPDILYDDEQETLYMTCIAPEIFTPISELDFEKSGEENY